MDLTLSHLKTSEIKKSIVCITSQLVPANNCVVLVHVKLTFVALLSGSVWFERFQSYFHFWSGELYLGRGARRDGGGGGCRGEGDRKWLTSAFGRRAWLQLTGIGPVRLFRHGVGRQSVHQTRILVEILKRVRATKRAVMCGVLGPFHVTNSLTSGGWTGCRRNLVPHCCNNNNNNINIDNNNINNNNNTK